MFSKHQIALFNLFYIKYCLRKIFSKSVNFVCIILSMAPFKRITRTFTWMVIDEVLKNLQHIGFFIAVILGRQLTCKKSSLLVLILKLTNVKRTCSANTAMHQNHEIISASNFRRAFLLPWKSLVFETRTVLMH